MSTTTHPQPDTQHHYLAGLFTLFTAILLAAGVLFGLTAGVGAIWKSVTSTGGAAPGPAGKPAATPAAAGNSTSSPVVHVVIRNVSTPEGPEPAFVGPNGVGAPTLFTATAGRAVTVVIDNKTVFAHTLNASGLGLDVSINPNASKTFTFTAKVAGTFDYQCMVPCGSWVMSHAGYMEGNLKVVAS